jgi:hypothetical protein
MYRFACWLERWASGLRSDLYSEMQIRDQIRYELTRVSLLLKERCNRASAVPLVQRISRRAVVNGLLLLAAAVLITAAFNEFPRSAVLTIGAAYIVCLAFIIHIGLEIAQNHPKE